MFNSFQKQKASHLKLGLRGEKISLNFLKTLGHEILAVNYNIHDVGEIDIISRDGAVLCFVEVKTRKYSWKSRPADAVNQKKKKRLRKTAQTYLKRIGHPPIIYRFDIVEVIVSNKYKLLEVCHWSNTFPLKEERFI